MRPTAGRSVVIRIINGQPCVCVPIARLGLRLTADGEVALLGFVHHYLGTWTARVAADEADPPVGGWDYGWDGRTALELPVLEQDAKRVLAAVRRILARPEATQPAVPALEQERAS